MPQDALDGQIWPVRLINIYAFCRLSIILTLAFKLCLRIIASGDSMNSAFCVRPAASGRGQYVIAKQTYTDNFSFSNSLISYNWSNFALQGFPIFWNVIEELWSLYLGFHSLGDRFWPYNFFRCKISKLINQTIFSHKEYF